MLNKRMGSLLVVGMLSMSLVGCASTVEQEPVEFKEEKKVEEQVVQPTNLVIESSLISFEITNIKKIKDWEGKDAIEIEYSFTNKSSDSPICGGMYTYFEVYQNGKQMEFTSPQDSEYNEQVDIMQGITQDKCTVHYLIEDDSTILMKAMDSTDILVLDYEDRPTFEIDLSNPDSISIVRVAN